MATKDTAPETTPPVHPASRPAGALSARDVDTGTTNPDQAPVDPDAELPKDSGTGAAGAHPEVSDTKIGDPEEPAGAQPVSVARQTREAWWCPKCDNSQTHDFERCAKCGTPKPKALKGR